MLVIRIRNPARNPVHHYTVPVGVLRPLAFILPQLLQPEPFVEFRRAQPRSLSLVPGTVPRRLSIAGTGTSNRTAVQSRRRQRMLLWAPFSLAAPPPHAAVRRRGIRTPFRRIGRQRTAPKRRAAASWNGRMITFVVVSRRMTAQRRWRLTVNWRDRSGPRTRRRRASGRAGARTPLTSFHAGTQAATVGSRSRGDFLTPLLSRRRLLGFKNARRYGRRWGDGRAREGANRRRKGWISRRKRPPSRG